MEWVRQPNDQFGNKVYLVQGLHPQDPHHVVCIPDEAFQDRMELYKLTTEEEALEHLMWEHHIRLNPDMPVQAAKIPDAVKANFDRVWGPGHKAARGLQMTRAEEDAQALRYLQIKREARTWQSRPPGSRSTPTQ